VAKKKAGECFLCGAEHKGRNFTFYSGVRKGGSRTELTTVIVTVFERWRDLRIYEIFVCRDCQLRLWADHTKWPPILWGGGAGLVALAAVLGGLLALLAPVAGLLVGVGLGMVALALGGVAVWFLLRHLGKKPEREQLELLVVREAQRYFPTPRHTFITVDQYQDLIRAGVVDV